MRSLCVISALLAPTGARAHAGHSAGTGHDLWIIAAAFVAAALFGLVRKA